MSFQKPVTAKNKLSVIDGKSPEFNEPLFATTGGYGVIVDGPNGTTTFEVLNALPLQQASVRASVERGTGYSVLDSDTMSYAIDSDLTDSRFVTRVS